MFILISAEHKSPSKSLGKHGDHLVLNSTLLNLLGSLSKTLNGANHVVYKIVHFVIVCDQFVIHSLTR